VRPVDAPPGDPDGSDQKTKAPVPPTQCVAQRSVGFKWRRLFGHFPPGARDRCAYERLSASHCV